MLTTCAQREKTVDGGEVYEHVRQAMVALVLSLDESQVGTTVNASPAWTVRDVLAHAVGITHDMNRSRFDLRADEWTKRQVEERRSASVAEMVDEWGREAPTFEDGLRSFGYEFGSHYVGDLHAHLQDVRSTLGLPPFDEDLVVRVALDFYLGSLDDALRETGAGALELVAGDERHVAGEGEALARVVATSFELLRVLSARRSRAQIRALDWTGDVEAVIDRLGRYPLPDHDLVD